MDEPPPLNKLERELLELCSMSGETTTTLDVEMLESSPGRATVEATLRNLVARGLLTTERGRSDRDPAHQDDWWDVTLAGRAAVGLPPGKSRTHESPPSN